VSKEINSMKSKEIPWEKRYDDLLRYQAELSFDLEQSFFLSSNSWNRSKRIIDFGSGNGYYGNMLAQCNPEKSFIFVEKNPKLAKIAKRKITSKNVEIVIGSFDILSDIGKFDFLYSRHTLSYLSDSERNDFFVWLTKNLNKNGEFLVIDADDDAFYTYPKLPLLEGGNEKFKEDLKKTGGNRSLAEAIPSLCKDNGFSHFSTRSLVVHSALSGRKYLMNMFMKSVAAIDYGFPLPNNVRDEMDNWANNHNSFLQYGLFGSLFVKGQRK
jgi:SAM-dependent methyltransferase